MDKRTAEALEKSINHWEHNLAAQTPGAASVSGLRCALCFIFARKQDGHCDGCPVMIRTGAENCDGSPYEQAAIALYGWSIRPFDLGYRQVWRVAAQKELDFLVSLRKPADGAAP